jgi:hypothetical protein
MKPEWLVTFFIRILMKLYSKIGVFDL